MFELTISPCGGAREIWAQICNQMFPTYKFERVWNFHPGAICSFSASVVSQQSLEAESFLEKTTLLRFLSSWLHRTFSCLLRSLLPRWAASVRCGVETKTVVRTHLKIDFQNYFANQVLGLLDYTYESITVCFVTTLFELFGLVLLLQTWSLSAHDWQASAHK